MPLIEGWVWERNLEPLLDVLAQLSAYDLHANEQEAIRLGVASSNGDASPPSWYAYEFHGEHVIRLELGLDHGAGIIQVRLDVPSSLHERVSLVVDLMSQYAFDPHPA